MRSCGLLKNIVQYTVRFSKTISSLKNQKREHFGHDHVHVVIDYNLAVWNYITALAI